MRLRGMGIFELVALRQWLESIYTAGRGYISVSKEQLIQLKNKLAEVDQEILDRVLNDEYVGAFLDGNFDDTLTKLKSGEFDGKQGDEESS